MKRRKTQLLFITCLIVIIFIPVIFSKYTSTLNKTITVNVRKPEYDVVFNHPLPNEYQEVEYIEGTGTQYILTDIIPDDTTGVYLKMLCTEYNYNLVYFGSGYHYPSINNGFWIGDSNNNQFYSRWDTLFSNVQKNILSEDVLMMNDTLYEFYFNFRNNRIITRNDIQYVNGLHTLGTKTVPISIFGYNNDTGNGSNVTHIGKYKLYEFIITKESNIIANYVPCYRKSDNEIGLYDMVTKKFYTNSGSGTFIKGDNVTNGYHPARSQHFVYGTAQNLLENNYIYTGKAFENWNTQEDGRGTTYTDEQNVNKLTSVDGGIFNLFSQWEVASMKFEFYPNRISSDYVELNYVKSDGTQAIITDVVPSDTTGVNIKLASYDITNDRIFFGSGNGNANTRFWIGNKNSKIYYGWNNIYGISSLLSDTTITNGEINVLQMNYLNDRNLKFNNTVVYSNLPTKTANTVPMAIFSYNNENTNSISNLKASMDLYELKISEGNSVIRNYVPSCQVSTDKAGLYETVTNTFYTNSIGEDLIKGQEIKSTQEIIYGNTENLNTNSYIRDGYVFINWNTKPDGSGTTYTNEQLITNNISSIETIKLYAQWKPTFEVTGNPNEWTNQDVVLTVVSEANSSLQYSFDGGTTWQSQSSAQFSTNQDVHVKIKDGNGIISDEQVVRITKIDKTPPTINNSMTPLIVTLDESNPISTLITASDNESGVDATGLQVYRYVIANLRRTDIITNTTYFKYPGLYAIDVEVSDVAGNTTSINSQILVRWPTAGKYVARRTELDNLSGGIIRTGKATGGTAAGLYKDNVETGLDESLPFSSKYYYSGAAVNNYVSFAGTTYRVLNVPVNDDVKLIADLSSNTIGWGDKKIYDSTIYSNWITKFGTSGYHQLYNSDDSRLYRFSDTEWAHFDLATFYAGRFERNTTRYSVDFNRYYCRYYKL